MIHATKRTVRGRRKHMREADPYLIKWAEEAKPNTCVVCGESMTYCLDRHHTISPKKIIWLCASCHRIFDKGGGIKELKERRKLRELRKFLK